jgi:hypothetical protein
MHVSTSIGRTCQRSPLEITATAGGGNRKSPPDSDWLFGVPSQEQFDAIVVIGDSSASAGFARFAQHERGAADDSSLEDVAAVVCACRRAQQQVPAARLADEHLQPGIMGVAAVLDFAAQHAFDGASSEVCAAIADP